MVKKDSAGIAVRRKGCWNYCNNHDIMVLAKAFIIYAHGNPNNLVPGDAFYNQAIELTRGFIVDMLIPAINDKYRLDTMPSLQELKFAAEVAIKRHVRNSRGVTERTEIKNEHLRLLYEALEEANSVEKFYEIIHYFRDSTTVDIMHNGTDIDFNRRTLDKARNIQMMLLNEAILDMQTAEIFLE